MRKLVRTTCGCDLYYLTMAPVRSADTTDDWGLRLSQGGYLASQSSRQRISADWRAL